MKSFNAVFRFIPLLFLLSAGTMAAEAPPAQPRNVLFITVDDLNSWVGYIANERHDDLLNLLIADPAKRERVIQGLTPNLDRLAGQSIAFTRAYCPSPLCGPSRTSFLTGMRASTIKYYEHSFNFRDTVPNAEALVTLPQHLKNQGYLTVEAGKIFHKERGGDRARPSDPQSDPRSWSAQHVCWIGTWWDFPPATRDGKDYSGNPWKYAPETTAADVQRLGDKPGPDGAQLPLDQRWHKGIIDVSYFANGFYWGSLPAPGDERYPSQNRSTIEDIFDWKQARFCADFLNRAEAKNPEQYLVDVAPGAEEAQFINGLPELKPDQPFFFGLGLFRPHDPFIITSDMAESLGKLIQPEDLDIAAFDRLNAQLYKDPLNRTGFELGRSATILAHMAKIHEAMLEGGRRDYGDAFHLWREAAYYYLASIHHADRCLGEALDALERSPYADDTIVVLLGDHGWNLGTKEHWSKMAMWEETCNAPLLIKAPGYAPGVCDEAVDFVNLYPTLLDLMGLPTPGELDSSAQQLEGRSLTALMRNPSMNWAPPAITTFEREGAGLCYAAADEQWRLIHYAATNENELYYHPTDPHEVNNLMPLGDDAPDSTRAAYDRLWGDLKPVVDKTGSWR
jgi:arylsulfatase A-like enzyme